MWSTDTPQGKHPYTQKPDRSLCAFSHGLKSLEASGASSLECEPSHPHHPPGFLDPLFTSALNSYRLSHRSGCETPRAQAVHGLASKRGPLASHTRVSPSLSSPSSSCWGYGLDQHVRLSSAMENLSTLHCRWEIPTRQAKEDAKLQNPRNVASGWRARPRELSGFSTHLPLQ